MITYEDLDSGMQALYRQHALRVTREVERKGVITERVVEHFQENDQLRRRTQRYFKEEGYDAEVEDVVDEAFTEAVLNELRDEGELRRAVAWAWELDPS